MAVILFPSRFSDNNTLNNRVFWKSVSEGKKCLPQSSSCFVFCSQQNQSWFASVTHLPYLCFGKRESVYSEPIITRCTSCKQCNKKTQQTDQSSPAPSWMHCIQNPKSSWSIKKNTVMKVATSQINAIRQRYLDMIAVRVTKWKDNCESFFRRRLLKCMKINDKLERR